MALPVPKNSARLKTKEMRSVSLGVSRKRSHGDSPGVDHKVHEPERRHSDTHQLPEPFALYRHDYSLVGETPNLKSDLDRDQSPNRLGPSDSPHSPLESRNFLLMTGDKVGREDIGPELWE